MARWSGNIMTFTPVAVADTNAFTNGGYVALQGGTSTQRINILEVYMGGQAGASSPSIMTLSGDSTVGTTLVAGRYAALDAASANLGTQPTFFSSATTVPQRSSSINLLNLSFNAFGGIVRWVSAPGEELGMLGNTASRGEYSLSAFTGGTPGLMGAHVLVEPW